MLMPIEDRCDAVEVIAWCSIGEVMIRRTPAIDAPTRTVLSLSVPPDVKNTSDGIAPIICAISRRDSSTMMRASRPALCVDEGLP